MPHLAPLKWFFLTVLFWTTLLFSMTVIWWQTAPQINPFTSTFRPLATPKWPW